MGSFVDSAIRNNRETYQKILEDETIYLSPYMRARINFALGNDTDLISLLDSDFILTPFEIFEVKRMLGIRGD